MRNVRWRNTFDKVKLARPQVGQPHGCIDNRLKQAGQTASKARFLAAPFLGLLETNAWEDGAAHANLMAQRLAAGIATRSAFTLAHPVEANAVFVDLPDGVAERLHALGWHFYNFLAGGGWRLMCSWDTTEADVRAFSADLDRALAC